MARAINRLINLAFAAASAPDYLSFRAQPEDHPRIQEKKLLAYLAHNQDTSYGRRHGFSDLTSVEAYQRSVPLNGYEDFRPYVDRIADGEKKVLTREEVLLLEPTGGTRSGSKRIPYTLSLKREFQAAVHTWIMDLYRAFPGLSNCRSYWSVTPAASRREVTPAGIPVGFEDDADYLGILGGALRKVFPVPPEIKNIRNMENFRYLTVFFLLRAQDLGLISVWNPTFLVLLLDYLDREREKLLKDIFDGELRLPSPEETSLLSADLPPGRERARAIEDAFRGEAPTCYAAIWPDLRVISCWADGAARLHAERLAGLFPGVRLQPKGLLSTECVLSFPLENLSRRGGTCEGGRAALVDKSTRGRRTGPTLIDKPKGVWNGAADFQKGVVAYRSHFFEFLEDERSLPRRLHELEAGGVYTVIVTTGGGLYRYNTQDRIEVTGRWRELPLVRFCGRNHVSDLVGEKLLEGHVEDAVEGVLRERGITYDFVLFAPEMKPDGGSYALFVEPASPLPLEEQTRILQEIDVKLRQNVQYGYARELGQLGPPEIVVLPPGHGHQAFIQRCLNSGQRLGDIKQSLLDHRTGWKDWFAR